MKLVHCLAALGAVACVSGASAVTPPLGAFGALAAPNARQNFFDTWKIDISGISPGTYNFDNWVIDATGSLLFGTNGFSVGLNYIDESSVRFTEFLDVNAEGTRAVGSGIFTVRNQCPIASCIWLDILGTQEIGSAAGYTRPPLIASVVSELPTGAMLVLGLAGVTATARRRRST